MNSFKKTVLMALVAALAFAALPIASVFAQDQNPPKGEIANEKLEQVWERQLKRYERLGRMFEDTDAHIAKAQELIDRAAANGKDVSAVQATLDAFSAAVKKAHPLYESLKGIVNGHQGFDANGKVTDAEKARSTVQAFHAKMQEIMSAMNGTGKALHDAIRTFREANRPANSAQGRDS